MANETRGDTSNIETRGSLASFGGSHYGFDVEEGYRQPGNSQHTRRNSDCSYSQRIQRCLDHSASQINVMPPKLSTNNNSTNSQTTTVMFAKECNQDDNDNRTKPHRRRSSNRRPSFGLISSQNSSRGVIGRDSVTMSSALSKNTTNAASQQGLQSKSISNQRDQLQPSTRQSSASKIPHSPTVSQSRNQENEVNVESDRHLTGNSGRSSLSSKNSASNDEGDYDTQPIGHSPQLLMPSPPASKQDEIEAKRRGKKIGNRTRRAPMKRYFLRNLGEDRSISKLHAATPGKARDRIPRRSVMKRPQSSDDDDEGEPDARASGSMSQDKEVEAKRRGLLRPSPKNTARRWAYRSVSSDDDDEMLKRSQLQKARKSNGSKRPGAEVVRNDTNPPVPKSEAKLLSYSYFTADDEATNQTKVAHNEKRLSSLTSNDTDVWTTDSSQSTRNSPGAKMQVELDTRRNGKVRVVGNDSSRNNTRNNSMLNPPNILSRSENNSGGGRIQQDVTQPLNLRGESLNSCDFDQYGRLLPGAIAVYGERYESDEEDEDYVNPDNFGEREQMIASQLRRSRQRNRQDWSHLQRLQERPPSSIDSSIVSDRHSHDIRPRQNGIDAMCHLGGDGSDDDLVSPNIAKMKRNGTFCPVAFCLLCLIGLIVGLVAGLRQENPTSIVISPVPSVSPSHSPTNKSPSMAPSISFEPSETVTLSPTSLPWIEKAIIEGEGIGADVSMIGDIIVATSESVIETFELIGESWVNSEQKLTGDMVVLGLTKQGRPLMVVREGTSFLAFEKEGRADWVGVGDPITVDDFIPTSLALAGQSESLVIGGTQGPTIVARVFDFVGSDWKQRGIDFSETTTDAFQVQVAISADGEIIVVGADDNFNGYTYAVRLEGSNNSQWSSVREDGKRFVGGPTVGISNDGSTVVCGSTSFIKVYESSTGTQIGEDLKVSSLASVSVSVDGKTVAFTYDDTVEVQQLVEESVWRPKGQLPMSFVSYGEILQLVSSISMSQDASRIVVGRSGLGVLQVSEHSLVKN